MSNPHKHFTQGLVYGHDEVPLVGTQVRCFALDRLADVTLLYFDVEDGMNLTPGTKAGSIGLLATSFDAFMTRTSLVTKQKAAMGFDCSDAFNLGGKGSFGSACAACKQQGLHRIVKRFF